MDWNKTGYPPRHFEAIRQDRRTAGWVFFATGLLLLVSLLGTMFFNLYPVVTALAAAMFLLFGVLASSFNFIDTIRYVRVVPYFERSIGDIHTYMSGYALARYLVQLDELAAHCGVHSISSFGFADDLRGETLVWYDPNEGLKSMATLRQAIEDQPVPATAYQAITSDLVAWEHALTKAGEQGVKFCVLLIHGNATSGHEWSIRQGSAF